MQCEANPAHHVPRGLLAYSKSAVEFIATDAVLASDDQPHGGQPLVQTKRRVFKDGPSLEKEFGAIMLRIALPHADLAR